jgi:diguanylate cyclase (GGDEF)-like protein/PAS domain S-box-containing protein
MPSDVFAPECMSHLAKHESSVTCSLSDIFFETTHIKKDGSLVDVSVYITVIKDENGEVKQRISNVIDISNRKNSEKVLQETHSKLEAIVSTIPDMIWIKDKKGIYLACNKTFEEIFQTTQRKIMGKTDYDFFSKEAADLCKISDVESLNSNTVLCTEEIITYPISGKKGILEVRKVPVLKANGDILGVLGIGRDITEQRQMEELLRKKEREISTLTQNLPDNIARWDTAGNYLYVNTAMEKTIGFKAEELLGKSIKVLVPHHIEVIGAIEKIQALESDSVTIRQHVVTQNRNIEIHEVKIIAEKNDKGELISILGIGRDITKVVSTQEQLKEAIELRRGIINSIPDLLFEIDRSGKYHNFWFHDNEVMNTYRESLIGQNIKDILPYQAAIIAFEALEEADKNGISLGKRYFLQEDNTFKWFELSISKKSDGNFVVLAHDITNQVKIQQQLAISEAHFRTITEHTSDTIARYDKDCTRTYANPAMAKMMGKEIEELIGKKPTYYVQTPLSFEYEEVIKRVIESGIEEDFEYSWLDKDNNNITSLIRLIPEIDSLGNVHSVLATGRNITKLKKYESELKKQKDFQDTLLHGVAEAGLSVSVIENGSYIYTNNFELAKEYGYDETIGEKKPSFLETLHPDDQEKVVQMYKKRLRGEEVPTTYSVVQVKPNGEERDHEVSVVLIPNTNPIQTLVVTKDITEQKNIEKRIEFMAHHDTLTGLPNRLLLQDRADRIIAQSKRNLTKSALLFIDLDGFKTINDSLGHSFGDIVLKTVAHRLQSCIRATDTLSRHGGDEFVVIIPEINHKDEVEIIARKIIQEFEKSFEVNNQSLSTSASIGIAIYPEHGKNFEQLLQNSDSAMYKAKENGKNTYCFFTQQMKHNMVGLFKMQNDLKEAIKNKEFVLHYQPQIDLSENKIVGAEALIRWKHPSMGMVPPMSFISVAESCGYIVEIGEWVIQEACLQGAIWNKNGKDIVIAVNVSAVQFRRGNLIEVVKKALQISKLNPKYLELELTESILISDTDNVLQTVKAIKELGVQLSIDDFGTGYSSLAYLKRFAVDKLKIDQSFVRDIVKDKDDATIVKTIIAMAKSFNLKAIAEGVENEEVLNVLQEFGCDEVQGYHFAKPMVADDFRDYYRQLITKGQK